MKVFAYYTSVISGAEIQFELVLDASPSVDGFVFQNTQSLKYEQGTYTEANNKFEALEKFKRIYAEMSPRFELI